MSTQQSTSSSTTSGTTTLPSLPTFRSPNLTNQTTTTTTTTTKSKSISFSNQSQSHQTNKTMIMPMNISNKINNAHRPTTENSTNPLPSASSSSSSPSPLPLPPPPPPPISSSRPRIDSFFGASTDQDDLQTSNQSNHQPEHHFSSSPTTTTHHDHHHHHHQIESIQGSSQFIPHQPGTPLPTVNLHNQHQHDRVPYREPNQFDEIIPDDQLEDDAYLPSPNPINPIDRPSSFYGLERHTRQSTLPGPSAPPHRISPSNSTHHPHPSSSQDPEARQADPMGRASFVPASRNSKTMSWSGSQIGSNRMSVYNRNSIMQSDGFPPPIPAGPLLDHSHLKPGAKAKLLNHAKTLELYRANAKKTNDVEVIFEFACFLMDLVKEMNEEDDDRRSINSQNTSSSPTTSKSSSLGRNPEREKEKGSLTQEAISLLQKLANRGHVESQYLLADSYTKAMGTSGGGGQLLQPNGLTVPSTGPVGKSSRQDYDRAFPLFVLAAKHGHVEAMFRAGQCCEHGWGTRKERDKALQFYRKAAIAQHPLAMYRLGLADLNGDLGQPRRPKDGVKWLKRAAETADVSNPKPLHELALLHERGIEHVVFVDFDYAVELLARAAELGYAPSAYKLGECYEYGRMGCPQDSALSIHYYNIAAQQNHKEACFALTAWYLVGSSGVLPQSDTEAYLWAKKAAEAGLAKAEYAIGYFTEVGIGTKRNERDAIDWFRKAAEHGDKRAMDRLKNGTGSRSRSSGGGGGGGGPATGNGKVDLNGNGNGNGKSKKGKEGKEDCLVM